MTPDKHAAEPWSVVRERDGSTGWRGIGIKTGTGFVANMVMRPGDENEIDNARRIVACVNALAGVGTANLETIARDPNPTVRLHLLAMLAKKATSA